MAGNADNLVRRIERLRNAMRGAGVDALFLAAGVNLEYAFGEPRRRPTPVGLAWPGVDGFRNVGTSGTSL